MADATHDLQAIVRGEIALAKAEVSESAKVLGKGAGLLAGAAFLALVGFLFVLNTLALVLAIWLPISAAYGIVTAVVLLVAVVLALLGRKALQQAKPAPDRAIDQAQQTIEALKNPSGSAPAQPGTTASSPAKATSASPARS